jgi:hypothetical protein
MQPESTFICPNCQLKQPFLFNQTRLISCFCQTVSSLDNEGKIEKYQYLPLRLQTFKPRWLKPGALIEYENEEYTLAGVFTYSVDYQLFNHETQLWEKHNKTTQEYNFRSKNGKKLCIQSEFGAFHLRWEVENIHASASNKFYDNNISSTVESGVFQITGFSGEDDNALIEQNQFYKVIQHNGVEITSEGTQKDFDDKSLKFYRRTPILKEDLEGFRAKYNPDYENIQKERSLYHQFVKAFGLITLFASGAWLFFTNANDTVITQNTVNFDLKEKQTQSLIFKTDLKKGQKYVFDANCFFAKRSSEVDFQVDFLQLPSREPVKTINYTFYSEVLSDKEETWSATAVSNKLKFEVPTTATYQIMAIPYHGEEAALFALNAKNTTKNCSGFLDLKLRAQYETELYAWAAFFALFMTVLFRWKWESLSLTLGLPVNNFGRKLRESNQHFNA